MTIQSIGDQARAFAMQSASSRIKTTLATLTAELSSGEVADLGGRLQGNTQQLAGMEARLVMLDQYDRNAAEIALHAQGMQDALSAVHSTAERLGQALFIGPQLVTDVGGAAQSARTAQDLQLVIGHLNGSVGQRFLFAGVESDTAPLVSADAMLGHLTTLVAGLTSAHDVAQAVSDWFDAPAGGFADLAYQGGSASQQTPVGDEVAVTLDTTALSPSVRDTLKGLATAALVSRGVLSSDPAEARALLRNAGKTLLDAGPALTGDMSQVGYIQQAVSSAQSQNRAAIATLTTARNTMREADPFATSTAINDAETRLQMLYTVIGRLSQLKLTDYVR